MSEQDLNPEQRARLEVTKALDWNLYHLSELLSGASREERKFDDTLAGSSGSDIGTYRDLWQLYNAAFYLKQKDWVADDDDKTSILDKLADVAKLVKA